MRSLWGKLRGSSSLLDRTIRRFDPLIGSEPPLKKGGGGDTLGDQRLADRRPVNLLEKRVDPIPRRLGDLPKHGRRIHIAGLQPIKVHDRHPAQAPHLDGKADVHHSVHRRCQDGNLQPQRTQLEGAVDFLRVDRDSTGDEGHLIEAVGPPCTLEAAKLDGFGRLERHRIQGRTHTHARRRCNRIEVKGCACTSEQLVLADYNGWLST